MPNGQQKPVTLPIIPMAVRERRAILRRRMIHRCPPLQQFQVGLVMFLRVILMLLPVEYNIMMRGETVLDIGTRKHHQ